MSGFGMLIEDPFYDEDGVLIDEDADLDTVLDPGDLVYNEDLGEWEDIKQSVTEVSREKPEACYIMDCDPYSTINS